MTRHEPALARKAAALTALCDTIRRRRAEFDRLRHIPQDIVEGFKSVGVYRAFVPTKFGGDALTPMAFLQLVETISAADASAGWVASFGVSSTYLAALPPETFAQIYGNNPDTVFAGGLFPPQKALRVAGGVQVSGRWSWCSGAMGADLLGGGIKVDGDDTPLPRTAVMPRDRITIDETWRTIGLRATGSHDLVVEKVVVPEDWTFVRGAPSVMEDAIFRYPAMALAAQVLAVVALGAAREALDFIRNEAAGKASITGAPTAGSRPYVQAHLARAEGKLAGARAQFFDATAQAWDELQHAPNVSRETHVRLRLASTVAAHEGAEVARLAFVMGGASAMMADHPLGRLMVDAACVAQHAFMGEGTWTSAGAAMFGEQTPPGFP
ncbi:Flavin-dependent monooxygenase, oxygenase subunit HsaA [Aquimixticola soesokkakensis]|uniref:Flavin-dependent monooxygenase, oxygenase subunit HsaA n=1 Tax=Aquimixticola soesokkakensis TaxID=1519096 RepID=A0A1Y5TAX8_9RHOB|nr:acyl-CoA dehydrogenase family protein [Aquimixticola soesokkakensis]SLN59941.1 Flavin-dependent monooxygenase, oxygenase subunit HsaA [Aquimixticola soesokkakensis]